MLAELQTYAGALTSTAPSAQMRPADLLLPVEIRKGDHQLRLFTTIMTLGTPRDVTLQELRIETFFPADESTAAAIHAMASAPA